MPTKPLSPCRHPGCPQLVSSGYCAEHRRFSPACQYESRRRNDEDVRMRRGRNWTAISKIVRALQPTCTDPLNRHNGWPVPSAQTHHIVEAGKDLSRIFDLSNCSALCCACHGEISAMERRGEPTAHLFVGKSAADTQAQREAAT